MKLGSAPITELRVYTETLLLVGLVTAGALVGRTLLPSGSAVLLYLLPVLAAASLHGLGPALFAAVLGALAYNFFFTEPFHTLRISQPGDVLTVLVLLCVAIFTGRLTARLRAQARVAAAQAERDAALAAFSRVLVVAMDEASLGQAICAEVSHLVDANALLVGPGEFGPRLIASEPPMEGLDTFTIEAAQFALGQGAPAGRGTVALPSSDWIFYPLATSHGVVGALGLARDDGLAPVEPGREVLLAMLLDQAALALERQHLAGEVAEVERLREQDRLRAALLSSVSHDLRTPLTSILAAAAQLRHEGRSDPNTLVLLDAEARRLDRYVGNLLDMVRLEAGALRLRMEPVDLTDAVAGVLHDLKIKPNEPNLRVDVPADLPLVRLDPQLFHHCLLNLVDNALRHGGGKLVTIQGERAGSGLVLEVLDEGPGLPQGQEAQVFETFVQLRGSDRQGGTGLGLAIVRGFAEAMGLSVGAINRPHGGAAFVLCIPPAQLVTDPLAEAG